MSVRIEFDDWVDASSHDVWSPTPRFRLRNDSGESLGLVVVLLSRTAEAVLLNKLGLDDEFGKSAHSDVVVRAILRYAVQEIERGLQQGTLPPENPTYAYELRISSDSEDIARVARLAGDKECDYQATEGRDLYCRAPAASDNTARFIIGGRTAAPTSVPLCRACALPDTDYL